MKKTSIEFFANEVFNIIQLHSDGKISSVKSIVDIAEALQQAKEMHKQEIEDAASRTGSAFAERYYEQTFKQPKQ
jgi:hypothetical protein